MPSVRIPTVRSSVAIISNKQRGNVDIGAEFYTRFSDYEFASQAGIFPVVVLDLEEAKSMTSEAFELCATHVRDEFAQFIGIGSDDDLLEILKLAPGFQFFCVLAHFQEPHFEYEIQHAMEVYAQLRQEKELMDLYDQQNRRLLAVSQDLEDRVQSRQKTLEHAQEKSRTATRRYEGLQRALIAVLRAHSIPEMERLLTAAISTVMEITWVRIVFAQQSSWRPDQTSSSFSILYLPLKRDLEELGSIFFGRKSAKVFKQSEEDFLVRVCEAVAFSVERLIQLDLSETLKTQWDTAFNSIQTPVLIVNDQYDVIRSNSAWNAPLVRENPEREFPIKKCYEQFFNRATPCPNCHLGQNFQASDQKRTFQVFSTSVSLPDETRATFVNLYQDISPRLEMEAKLLESAKSAELGLVGGSIAHELNNPLGGIMMFLSLILQDVEKSAPFYSDIVEMEKAALKCKSIIENMLAFARQEDVSERVDVSLEEIVRRATSLLELKTRSAGIKITIDPIPLDARISISPNITVQALVNLLQASCERISSRRKQGLDFKEATIQITTDRTRDGWQLMLQDNGEASDEGARGSVVGLTVARHILRDQGALIQIVAKGEQSTLTTVDWPWSI
jgi:two-component system NtrC family sensor kinase